MPSAREITPLSRALSDSRRQGSPRITPHPHPKPPVARHDPAPHRTALHCTAPAALVCFQLTPTAHRLPVAASHASSRPTPCCSETLKHLIPRHNFAFPHNLGRFRLTASCQQY
ncbi:hypothetical protein LY76DRAFT_429273 [Colletotrichum caudatum]|nr:hypothetical protein LY76DRAFT_429273 [Colletotrichum caudatum]